MLTNLLKLIFRQNAQNAATSGATSREGTARQPSQALNRRAPLKPGCLINAVPNPSNFLLVHVCFNLFT